MQSVIITGADGFIGRNLVRYMSGQGVLVYALVLANSPNIAKIKDLENIIGGCRCIYPFGLGWCCSG